MVQINIKRIDFSKQLSEKLGYPLSYSKKIIEDMINSIILNTKKRNLILKKIGTFKIIRKNKRFGRNPKTKEIFEIKERKTISFSPSKSLNRLING